MFRISYGFLIRYQEKKTLGIILGENGINADCFLALSKTEPYSLVQENHTSPWAMCLVLVSPAVSEPIGGVYGARKIRIDPFPNAFSANPLRYRHGYHGRSGLGRNPPKRRRQSEHLDPDGPPGRA
jgi:hypothetical protein